MSLSISKHMLMQINQCTDLSNIGLSNQMFSNKQYFKQCYYFETTSVLVTYTYMKNLQLLFSNIVGILLSRTVTYMHFHKICHKFQISEDNELVFIRHSLSQAKWF